MGIFRGKDGNFRSVSLGPMDTCFSVGASSPDSGAPSLDQGFYNNFINSLDMGDASQAAFDQAANADLLNQLAANEQTDEEVLSSVVGAAPSGTPLGRLSDEDL